MVAHRTNYSMTGQPDAAQLNAVVPVPIELTANATGHEHVLEVSHITDVLIGDHHVISGDGAGQYIVWLVRVVVDDAPHSPIVLYKRYRHIEKLRDRLVAEFPRDEFPQLPPKDNFSVLRLWLRDLWLEHRRKGLQWFLTSVLLNPKYQHSSVVNEFVLGLK